MPAKEPAPRANANLDRTQDVAPPDFQVAAPSLAAPPALSTQPADPDRVGPYQILEVLGEGGMGSVYVAEQHEPIRRKVALKIIKLGMDTREFVARFESERQALSILTHPNLAGVLDAGATPEGRPFFVMEYVPGRTLVDYCDRERLSTRERLELFMQVCEGVQHAHQKGIIHRDFKPANILVLTQDDKRVPKIIDFGLAKATSGERLTDLTLQTEVGQIMGTPAYMSPEQTGTNDVDIDTRADVYSLGVILYELLAGTLPFDPETLHAGGYMEIQRIIREEEPAKPSTKLSRLEDGSQTAAENRSTDVRSLARRLKGDLDWIVMKCLEKDRIRRYESAIQLAEDIQRHLNDEPVRAGPPGIGYQLSKFLKRNRPAVAGAALVVVAVLVGLGVGEGGLVVAVSTVLVLLVAGLGVSTALLRRSRVAQRGEERQRGVAEEQKRVAEMQKHLAEEQRAKAKASEFKAEARYREIVRLSDVKRLSDLEGRAAALWPALPEKLPAMEDWLAVAEALGGHLDDHRSTLEALRSEALPYREDDIQRDHDDDPVRQEVTEKTDERERLLKEIKDLEQDLAQHEEPTVVLEEEEGPHALTRAEKETKLAAMRRQVARLSAEIETLKPRVGRRSTWRFARTESQWRHDVLAELVAGLERLCDGDPTVGTIASVKERVTRAHSIEEESRGSAEAAAAWAQATADIAGSPVYGGLQLAPQLGLVPLRRDAQSGLWEFWHVQSGERPRPLPDADAVNPWLVDDDTGIVLVLIPGGPFTMGAQKENPEGPNYDPGTSEKEGPPHEVMLSPFLMSRYLMTQGQWLRITGSNPSGHDPNHNYGGKQHDLRHPVEQVSWEDCTEVLERLALGLPTEAQWECATRAGTTTPWWTGTEKESLQGAANLADRFAKANAGHPSWRYEE